jgi:ribonuclease-3
MLGKGEEQQGGRENSTNISNAIESLIGAIYLDSDLKTVRNIIFTLIMTDSVK